VAIRAQVAVVRTSPARVLEDYQRVLEISGCAAVLAEADRVVAYGNLTWNLFFPAVSSPPWQLDGVAATLRGRKGVRWVTGTGHTGRPRRGARANGWPAALARHDQALEPVQRTDHTPLPPHLRLMALDRILPAGTPVPSDFRGTVALHLPTWKTHGQLGLAGAMENAWATWLPNGGGLAAAHPHEVVVDLMLLQRATHSEVCAVMDGTVAGDGAGPRTVDPMETNVLLAATDPVALDSVAARLSGIDPFQIRYLALAYALGLGCADTDAIELVGDDVSGLGIRLHTRRPPAALARAALGQARLTHLERVLFAHRRWLTLASTAYYDLYWYNLVGRRRLAGFRASPWGHLFATYV
jgi:uncharacterized protein (DUF362 family)